MHIRLGCATVGRLICVLAACQPNRSPRHGQKPRWALKRDGFSVQPGGRASLIIPALEIRYSRPTLWKPVHHRRSRIGFERLAASCWGWRSASFYGSSLGWLSGGYCNLLTATVTGFLLIALSMHAAKAADTAAACVKASTTVERTSHLPAGLLSSIGLVEAGRLDPESGVFRPWPWSVDADGVGHFYPTKRDAIAATAKMEAAGIASIDVGCMQINLHEHPLSFASLETAFDPTANTAYAAKFLWELYHKTGNWIAAAAAYHSQTPGVADAYRRQVVAQWRHGHPDDVQPTSADVDPYHVLTVAFRRQLVVDAQFRDQRDAAIRGRAHRQSAAVPRATILSEEGNQAQ